MTPFTFITTENTFNCRKNIQQLTQADIALTSNVF